mgnify:CR=1 FL=1
MCEIQLCIVMRFMVLAFGLACVRIRCIDQPVHPSRGLGSSFCLLLPLTRGLCRLGVPHPVAVAFHWLLQPPSHSPVIIQLLAHRRLQTHLTRPAIASSPQASKPSEWLARWTLRRSQRARCTRITRLLGGSPPLWWHARVEAIHSQPCY